MIVAARRPENKGLKTAAVLFVMLLTAAVGLAADDTGIEVTEVLLLGPFPSGPEEPAAPPLAGETELVPEIDPTAPFPQAGETVAPLPGRSLTWRRATTLGAAGCELPEAGIYWLASRIRLDRWTELSLSVATEAAVILYLDGEELASKEAEKIEEGAEPEAEPEAETEAEQLAASSPAGRGVHTVLVRLEVPSGSPLPGRITITATTDPEANLAWTLQSRREPASLQWTRQVATISGLAVAPGGKLYARRLSRRYPSGEGSQHSVEVFDGKGRLVVSGLGGESATPVCFAPDWKQLLLARSGESGRDLLLWTAPDGLLRPLVEDEPGLGLVRFSPDGKYLLLASTRGVEPTEVDEDAAHRRQHLRERVPDYDTHTHLHLVDIVTESRRRLTLPGDHVLEDACFFSHGRQIIYGRTVPRKERPWFETEFRLLDLATGADELLATFVGGWEVRPQSFALSPDDRQLAFIGPPDQVGGGRPEHNVYNKQLWLLDLGSRTYERITTDLPYSFDGGGGLPGWDRQGRSLYSVIGDGSRTALARLQPDGAGPWRVTTVYEGGMLGGAVLDATGSQLLYTETAAVQPASLWLRSLPGGDTRLQEQPNADLTTRWQFTEEPQDVSFTGPGGETIDAWWYRPTVRVDPGKSPLIIYYYGGCCPTYRGFSTTHQWLAANGYAVLVVNPRGAHGFGDEFADFHAGDFGPKASADILAGLDHFLAEHPGIDGQKVGIYGGSYGGFMTEYLVTTTDRFAAAVSMYGISDLGTYWGQGVWGWTYGDMAAGGATPWSDPELFWRHSPLFRADRITTPLLLLHGEDDANVTPGESEQLFTALSIQDKPVELVLFPGEGHGISGSFANRVDHRTMMLEWFDRFLRDQPEAWLARWE
ncbi:MAG: S9 family peptidase [bacterium]